MSVPGPDGRWNEVRRMSLLPYEKMTGRGIYVHIPFCVRKCRYCDFLSFPAREDVKKAYVKALMQEISLRRFPGEKEDPSFREKREAISSVFFGGGTPTAVPVLYLVRLLEAVIAREEVLPGAEITVECNPGTAGYEEFMLLRTAGFNRLSIGLQSANNDELRMLGRIHSFEDYVRCVEDARRAGFENINTDLIFSLPGQSIGSWRDTLEKVVRMGMEHVSAYSLIIEEGTSFWDLYHEEDEIRQSGGQSRLLPGEDEEREMYLAAEEVLGSAGMKRYEISNFSLPGKESVHNTGTWLRRDYEGFGLGAASLAGGGRMRLKNTERMENYLAGRWEEPALAEKLDETDQMAEAMFLGLRLKEGVSRERFYSRYKKDPAEVYPDPLRKLMDERLLEVTADRIRLTQRGTDVANVVMAAFLS